MAGDKCITLQKSFVAVFLVMLFQDLLFHTDIQLSDILDIL